MKVTIDYDPASGSMYDLAGVQIGTALNLIYNEVESKSTNVESLCEMKRAGFTAEEIIELSLKNLV